MTAAANASVTLASITELTRAAVSSVPVKTTSRYPSKAKRSSAKTTRALTAARRQTKKPKQLKPAKLPNRTLTSLNLQPLSKANQKLSFHFVSNLRDWSFLLLCTIIILLLQHSRPNVPTMRRSRPYFTCVRPRIDGNRYFNQLYP